MKTFNKAKHTGSALILASLLAGLLAIAACGSKGGNDSQPQPTATNAFQQCVNCQNLFQAYSEYNNNFSYGYSQSASLITLNWSFQSQLQNQIPNQYPNQYTGYPQPVQPQQYNPYAPYGSTNYGGGYAQTTFGAVSPVISYNGPVSASGILSVSQATTLGYCQIPAGNYNLGTVAQGHWSAGIVSNLRLQAVGPVAIFLTLTQGQVAAKTGSQLGSTWSEIAPLGRIFGNLNIESINGQPCSQSILVQ